MTSGKQDYQSIPIQQLLNLNCLDFKLVPLGSDSRTPAIESTRTIYDNPNYWTHERIQAESYRFKNVATLLGLARSGLYLNELDIDSTNVANILSNLQGEGGHYSLVLESQKRTYVVKTKKLFGYRIYWQSHKQNKPIHTSDCKPGYEFEIKTDISGGHSTLPPSRHRDDPNFIYSNTGQNSIVVNDQIYDELIRLLSDCLKPAQKEEESKLTSPKDIELSQKDIKTIVDAISPYYIKNYRNTLVFALSGLLRRFNISHDSAINVIQDLVKDDEEKRARIDVLEETYSKNQMDVNGSKYFTSILESIIGADKVKAKEAVYEVLTVVARRKKKETLITLEILENNRFVTIEETGDMWYYKNGVYNRGGDILIKKIIESDYIDDANINLRREVLEHIKCMTYQPLGAFDADINIINKPNGLYHIDTDTLEPHSPSYLSLIQNPIPYIKGAKPKLFGKFLSQLVYPSDVRTLVDFIAYTFWRYNEFEFIPCLIADGSNGKSVLFAVLTCAHGEKNVSNVPLKTLIERPFARYDLVGKNCNLDAELSSKPIEDTAILKNLTGNTPQYVEGKNKDGFEIRLYVKLWLSANKMIEIINPTNADYRRFVPINLPNRFDDVADPLEGTLKLDPDLQRKLTTDEEQAGVFNVLMIALRRLLKRKKIYLQANTIAKRRERFELASNPLDVFIEEAFLEADEVNLLEGERVQATKKDTVFQAYNIFRKDKKLPIISPEGLGKQLKAKGWMWQKVTDGDKRHNCWMHVRFRKEWLDRLNVAGNQETLV